MMRAHIRQVGIDGHDLDVLIGFWSAVLGYQLHHREAGYAVLCDPEDAQPRIFLQQVPETKLSKNRVHMDIEVPDEAAAVERLTGLGARVLWREDFTTHHWTVLADPEESHSLYVSVSAENALSTSQSAPKQQRRSVHTSRDVLS